MWKTSVSQLLGIDWPVIQGGMAWCSEGRLAAAVANGGGLGLIAAGSAPAAWVKEQIALARSLTQKLFGVNIMLMSPYAAEIAQLVADEGVHCVFTGAGMPGPYMPLWKAAGVLVVPVVPSVAIAKRVVKQGADAVVCEGCEAGGHIGELTTMTLVPQVADAVEVPVIAAGGIADGRGMAAAFMLGAAGVQMGTRFLCAEECTVHQNFKDKVMAAHDTDTMVTGRSTGHPVQALKNRVTRDFQDQEDAGASSEVLEAMLSGGLRRAAVEGDMQQGSLMAGQSAGMVTRMEPAADIIHTTCLQARMLLQLEA